MSKVEKGLLVLFILLSQIYFTFVLVEILKPEEAVPLARKIVLFFVIGLIYLFVSWTPPKG